MSKKEGFYEFNIAPLLDDLIEVPNMIPLLHEEIKLYKKIISNMSNRYSVQKRNDFSQYYKQDIYWRSK